MDHGVVCLEAPEWPPVASVLDPGPGRAQRLHPARHHPVRHARPARHGRAHVPAGATHRRTHTGARILRGAARRDADTLDAQLGAAAHEHDAHPQTQDAQRGADANRAAHGPGRHDLRGALPPPAASRSASARRGAGKTHAAAVGARAWEAVGGEVIGLTCAQAARDVLLPGRDQGVSYNTTKFLMKSRPGMPVRPGTLFVVDEGSMVSMSHLARIIDLAEKHGCKVFVTGDHKPARRRRVRRRHGHARQSPRAHPARRAGAVREPNGNATPACACAQGTRPLWTPTPSTGGSSAAAANEALGIWPGSGTSPGGWPARTPC